MRATVVGVVWPVYWVEREGLSMERRKMDLLDCDGGMSVNGGFGSRRWRDLTAYAMRSPLGSAESWVGCPRVVEGEGAQMASGVQC